MKFSMKKTARFLKNIGVTAIALSCSQTALANWTTKGAQVIDPNGEPFVYRGVNLGFLPQEYSLPFVMSDIAATGANAVRIPVQPFGSKELLRKYISLCKQNKLLCVLTDTSTYGYGENTGTYTYSDPWFSWMSYADVLNGNEDYAVIEIASAPTGNTLTGSYIGLTGTGIFLLRNAGLKHQLIIDGANWGQDWEHVMRDNAENLQARDPLKNVVFAVHMYEAYNEPEKIRSYLSSYLDRQLPIMIAEFAPMRRHRPNEVFSPHTNKDVDEDAIMQISQELGVGYFGWTWSSYAANSTDSNMVVDFNPGQLTPWGNKFIHSENGVKATSKLATHYSNSSSVSSASSSSSASSQTGNRAPYAIISARVIQERCGSVYAQLSGAESTDPDGDELTYKWEIYNPNNYSYEYQYGKEIKFSMRPTINYSFSLYIDDGKGGTSTATRQLSHSYSDNCIASSSSSSVVNSSSSSIWSSSSSKPSSISSSSIRSSSLSSSSRSSSSSLAPTAVCSYVVNSQWHNGFTAAIRIKNTSTQTISGWSVNWQYADGSKITGSWNTTLTGANPYNAKNLSWNSNIQPGQTIEFGFQGSKPNTAASIPMVTGGVCQ